MNLIGINGYIGSGKDTVGMIIQALTMDGWGAGWRTDPIGYVKAYEGRPNLKGGWEIKKYAAKLKQIASILTGIPVEKFEDQEFKKDTLTPQWSQWTTLTIDSRSKDVFYGEIFDTEERAKQEVISTERRLKRKGITGVTVEVAKRDMTVREFLQKLGTEGMRNGVHSEIWVNALFADYKPTKAQCYEKGVLKWDGKYYISGSKELFTPEERPEYFYDHYPNWIITDTRFPNEAKAIKDRGGIVVRVNRSLKTMSLEDHLKTDALLTSKHPSEISLDDWEFDYVLENHGTIEDLSKSVKDMLQHFKII